MIVVIKTHMVIISVACERVCLGIITPVFPPPCLITDLALNYPAA